MSGNVQELVCTIEQIVKDRGQVLGSQLATELKRRDVGWSPAAFGVSSLRQFIGEHVAAVAAVGRSGLDVIYGPVGTAAAATPVASSPSVSSEDIWRIWVSPRSRLALQVDRAAGNVHAVARDAVAPENKVVLPAPDVNAHRDIAHSFLTKAPAPLREKLGGALESTDENWWRAWRAELQGTEFWNEWSAHRRQQFEHLLAAGLRANGLDDGIIGNVVAALRDNRAKTAAQAKQSSRDASGPASRARLPEPALLPRDLRWVVTEVVQRMNDAELRELRVPLGLVLDALAAAKKT